MNLDAVPAGKNPPDDINVVIEVPIGGEPIKYEMDKASGTLFVDRFLYTPMRYPGITASSLTLCRTTATHATSCRQHPSDRARRGDQLPHRSACC